MVPPQGFYSSSVENQFTRCGIPGAWWDSTLSSLLVHPSVGLWQEEDCGFCRGSICSLAEDTTVETLPRHVRWTIFFNFMCIFKLCYTSGREGDGLTCFLMNAVRLFRRKSFRIMQWSC